MPTKHKRKRGDDEANFNLPPTTKARSLPIIEPTKDFITPRNAKRQKVDEDERSKDKRPRHNADDTPKGFARLMAWHQQGKRIGGGLDNGLKPSKVKSKGKPTSRDGQPKKAMDQTNQTQKQQKQQKELPEGEDTEVADSTSKKGTKTPQIEVHEDTSKSSLKILPGESLRDFSLRVDQSLPLSSIAKTKANPASLPEDLREKEKKARHLTKHNKRLARMQLEWRNTEAKLKAKEEEEAEENVEKLEEDRLLWDGVKVVGKKGKKRLVDDGDDPWKELERKRRAEEGRLGGGGGRKGRREGAALGLTAKDQVQAPPTLGRIKNIFKERPVHRTSLRAKV